MSRKVVVLRKGMDGKVGREVMTLEGVRAAKVAAQAEQQLSAQSKWGSNG